MVRVPQAPSDRGHDRPPDRPVRDSGAAGDLLPADLTDGQHPRASRRLEVTSAVICLALSLTLYLGARDIEVRTETGGIDPRWWPQLLGLAGTALSLPLLVAALLRPPAERDDLMTSTTTGRRRLGLALVASVAMIVLWPLVGFVVAGALFVAGLTCLFGGRGWRTLVLFPLVLTGLLYGLFAVLLEVPL